MPSKQQIELMIFKAQLDEEKSKLQEIFLRHEDPYGKLPAEINGEKFSVLNNYLVQLQNTMTECDKVRQMILDLLKEAK